jgi:hypothetical protein
MSDDEQISGLDLSQIAKHIYSARKELGWQILDPSDLVNRLKIQEIGLSAEDEFITLVNWLGKCKLVHKLDQEQFPLPCRDSYQVPDLLAVFKFSGSLQPVLIEVKTTTNQLPKPLSWKPDYLNKLKRYSSLLNLPLLVAWKCRIKSMNLSFWLLFDIEIFQQLGEKFIATFESATNENLLGQLAGDFLMIIKSGTSFNMDFYPIGNEWKSEPHEGDSLFGQLKVYGANENGVQIPDLGDEGLSRGLFSILQCIPLFGEYSSYTTDSAMIQNWKLEHNQPLFLHQMLSILMAQSTSSKDGSIWGRILHKNKFPALSGEILKAAESSGILEIMIGQLPKTTPTFLQEKPG